MAIRPLLYRHASAASTFYPVLNSSLDRGRVLVCQLRRSVATGHGCTGDTHCSNGRDKSEQFAQFTEERERYHRHSFYEKGSSKYGGSGEWTGSTQPNDDGDGHIPRGKASATAQQRRQLSAQWENAFFGRVHYEVGMHDRYETAVNMEEETARKYSSSSGPTSFWVMSGEEVPLHVFRKWSSDQQRGYIIERLTMGERRIRYAPDYGSLSMMYQLNIGAQMIKEAEGLLMEMGWMNTDLAERIAAVRKIERKIIYDFDLD